MLIDIIPLITVKKSRMGVSQASNISCNCGYRQVLLHVQVTECVHEIQKRCSTDRMRERRSLRSRIEGIEPGRLSHHVLAWLKGASALKKDGARNLTES